MDLDVGGGRGGQEAEEADGCRLGRRRRSKGEEGVRWRRGRKIIKERKGMEKKKGREGGREKEHWISHSGRMGGRKEGRRGGNGEMGEGGKGEGVSYLWVPHLPPTIRKHNTRS